jgi:hypothetical protein
MGIAACGGEADSTGASCVAGMTAMCACPGGVSGVQTCNALGTFDPCICSDDTGEDTDTEGDTDDSADADSDSGDATTGDSGDGPVCGNGVEEAGECDPEGTNYCAIDCEDDGTTTGDEGSTGEVDVCAGMPIYIDMVAAQPSVWTMNAVTGFGAGNMMCQALGADGVCTYTQIVDAETQGDFAAANITAGTTAWVHRQVAAQYMGNNVAADSRSRCADWTYATNHENDGEFLTFGAGGAVTFTLDTDAASFPAGEMDCGGVNRAILCCNTCP